MRRCMCGRPASPALRPLEGRGPALTRSSFCYLRCNIPPDTSLLFGAVFRDPASISFRERVPESGGFKVLAVSRRSGLLPPGVVQITTIHGVEAKIVDEAKHR